MAEIVCDELNSHVIAIAFHITGRQVHALLIRSIGTHGPEQHLNNGLFNRRILAQLIVPPCFVSNEETFHRLMTVQSRNSGKLTQLPNARFRFCYLPFFSPAMCSTRIIRTTLIKLDDIHMET
ncbi:hypothetical protein D3C85_1160650 [compost metagenome]